jgi:hypothetical protein
MARRRRVAQLRPDQSFKGRQFTAEVILWAVRWYLMFPVSYRDLELMLADRGVTVDHTTLFRWVQTYAPEIEKRIRITRQSGCGRVLPHLRLLPDRSSLPHELAPEASPLPQPAMPVAASATSVAATGASVASPPLPAVAPAAAPNTSWRAASPRHCFTRRCRVRSSVSG